MSVTLTAPFGDVLENGKTMLSNVDAFQTWVGAVNAAAALASIHLISSDSWSRPFVELWLEGAKLTCDGIGSGNEFHPHVGGQLILHFEGDVDTDYADDLENMVKSFMDDVLGIISGLADLAGTETYLVAQFGGGFAPVDPEPELAGPLSGEGQAYWRWDWALDLSDGSA